MSKMTRREDEGRDAKKIEVWHPSIRSTGHQAGVAVVTNREGVRLALA